jgi:hypothetical protein
MGAFDADGKKRKNRRDASEIFTDGGDVAETLEKVAAKTRNAASADVKIGTRRLRKLFNEKR